jgi:hypothetical protein
VLAVERASRDGDDRRSTIEVVTHGGLLRARRRCRGVRWSHLITGRA